MLRLALFVALLFPFAAAIAAPPVPYHVLFIAVDDLNDWIGCYSSNANTLTPNLDRFAKGALVFDNAHCAYPLCNPSRTAVMTGLRPSTTGVYDNDVWFRELPRTKDAVTLAQHFGANGYRTVQAGKIFHTPIGVMSDPASWQEQPPGRFGGGTPQPPENEKWTHGLREKWSAKSYSHKAFDFEPISQPKEETQDWKVGDYFAAQFAKKQEQPCFFAAGFFRPHLPWYAPQEFYNMHPLADIQLPKGAKDDDLDDLPPAALKWADTEDHRVIAGNGKWKDAIRGYLACISFADACIGHLLDAVEKSPDRERTIVVIWGDHGWHLGEKKAWQKPRPWERCTKVPLLVRAPGVTQPGSRCARPVSLLDLYPTLTALCGLPAREGVEGRSIVPLLGKPDAEWPYSVVTTIGAGNHSVRNDRWRYMRYANGDEELYDHASDPNEWTNLAKDSQYIGLKAEMAKWIPTTDAPPGSSPEGDARRKSKAIPE